MTGEFTDTQKRTLAVLTVIAILFGAYFLRGYFILIVVAAIGAYLFTPLFARLTKRFNTGVSAAITLLVALLAVVIPATVFVLLATAQITQMVRSVSNWVSTTDLSALGDRTLRTINGALAHVPFLHINLTQESLRHGMTTVAQHGGQWFLAFLQTTAGGLVSAIASSIIFLYVFVALLVKRDKVVTLIHRLNPLGDDVTDLYLGKIGAMVHGTVKGQFIIAFCQGVAAAASIYIAGIHQGFFLFVVLLTALSVIPLGGGILTIPLGIGMALFGHVAGGVFIIVWHLLVVTNIDNFLRPVLVPRQARLDPALMLLAVFSGIAMFGFWGIVIGPVLMIVIVTTISVYLLVYKGIPLDVLEDEDEKPRRRWWRFGRGSPEKNRARADAKTPDSAVK